MLCIYCGRESGPYDEHEACVEASLALSGDDLEQEPEAAAESGREPLRAQRTGQSRSA